MAENVLKGKHPAGRPRAPRVYADDRVCRHRGCTTRLSRYNRREFCHVHAPLRFPRIRGRVVTDS